MFVNVNNVTHYLCYNYLKYNYYSKSNNSLKYKLKTRLISTYFRLMLTFLLSIDVIVEQPKINII